MKDFAADTNYVNGWHLSCIAAGMTLQCKSTLGVALAALMVACGGVGSATAGAPDLDGSTDVPSGDDPGVDALATDGGATEDGATGDAGPTNGWSAIVPSAYALTSGTGCDPTFRDLHGLAMDPTNPDRFVTVQDCKKGNGADAKPWLLYLDIDVSKGSLTVKELPQAHTLGLVVTSAGRAVAGYSTPGVAGPATLTLLYRDVVATSWTMVSRTYSDFEGAAQVMASHGDRIVLAGTGLYDVSDTANPGNWTRRGNDIPSNIASGLSFSWIALDGAHPTTLLVATDSPLAVYTCNLPDAGNATCAARPADQGFAGAYPQWTGSFVHPAGLSTVWSTAHHSATSMGAPMTYASADHGLTFSPLTFPAPVPPVASTTAVAGDPHDAKTSVIARTSAGAARLFATRDGGLTFHEVPGFPGLSRNVTDLGIDASGGLVVVSHDAVYRRATF